MGEIRRDLIFKICLFGDNKVGKTSLIQAIIQKQFYPLETKPAPIIDIEIKDFNINSLKITLQIWIFRFKVQDEFFFPIFLRGTSGAIFIYDITNYSSINHLDKWITPFKENLPAERKKIPLIMVGGKLDLYKERALSKIAAKKISKKYNFHHYFECSAKTGENIEDIFYFLIRKIMEI